MSKTIITDENKRIKGIIHEDGCITEGTSRKIVGRVHTSTKENESKINTGTSAGGGLIFFVIVIVIFVFGFGIFKVPEIVINQYENVKDVEDIANAVSMTITLLAMGIIGCIAGKLSEGSFLVVYSTCCLTCGICIIIDYILLEHSYSIFMMIFLVPMVSVVMAVIPALVITAIMWLLKICHR